jgi:hypothetical protein
VIPVAQIAALQLDLHQGNSAVFDYFEPGDGDDAVCWAAKKSDGVTLICLRGSVTPLDWLRDLYLIPDPLDHPKLGPVHAGFMLGVEKAWSDIQLHTSGPWIVSGHSLGAARSALLAGLMTCDGKAPLARIGFGEPKPGAMRLAALISDIPQHSYRNGETFFHDLITDYPPVPPYVHPVPLTTVKAAPSLEDDLKLSVFAWHHMALYAQAVGGIPELLSGKGSRPMLFEGAVADLQKDAVQDISLLQTAAQKLLSDSIVQLGGTLRATLDDYTIEVKFVKKGNTP